MTLLIENAGSNGVRPLTYSFDIATDAGFSNKVFSRDGIAQGDGGRTSLRMSDALATGHTYYWRARAQDGANTGPYATPTSVRHLHADRDRRARARPRRRRTPRS